MLAGCCARARFTDALSFVAAFQSWKNYSRGVSGFYLCPTKWLGYGVVSLSLNDVTIELPDAGFRASRPVTVQLTLLMRRSRTLSSHVLLSRITRKREALSFLWRHNNSRLGGISLKLLMSTEPVMLSVCAGYHHL